MFKCNPGGHGGLVVTQHAFSLPGGVSKPEVFEQESPGVELVVPSDSDDVLTVPCRKLIGALTRRLQPKFVAARRLMDPASKNSAMALPHDTSWSDHISACRTISQTQNTGASRIAVHIRGLADDEPAVLVDGRPAPACVVDLASAAVIFVDRLRKGEKGLVIVHPSAQNAAESELWEALAHLCQDRLGIERGVLDFKSSSGVERQVYAVA